MDDRNSLPWLHFRGILEQTSWLPRESRDRGYEYLDQLHQDGHTVVTGEQRDVERIVLAMQAAVERSLLYDGVSGRILFFGPKPPSPFLVHPADLTLDPAVRDRMLWLGQVMGRLDNGYSRVHVLFARGWEFDDSRERGLWTQTVVDHRGGLSWESLKISGADMLKYFPGIIGSTVFLQCGVEKFAWRHTEAPPGTPIGDDEIVARPIWLGPLKSRRVQEGVAEVAGFLRSYHYESQHCRDPIGEISAEFGF